MTIFIDADYKCHVDDDNGGRAVDVPFFDGKCRRFIEGYRYVPAGEVCIGADGTAFQGPRLEPHTDYALLEVAQEQYEEMLAELQDMQTALYKFGVKDNA